MANNDKLKMILEKNPKLLKKVDKKTEMLSADVFQDDESFKEFRTTEEDTDKELKSMKESLNKTVKSSVQTPFDIIVSMTPTPERAASATSVETIDIPETQPSSPIPQPQHEEIYETRATPTEEGRISSGGGLLAIHCTDDNVLIIRSRLDESSNDGEQIGEPMIEPPVQPNVEPAAMTQTENENALNARLAAIVQIRERQQEQWNCLYSIPPVDEPMPVKSIDGKAKGEADPPEKVAPVQVAPAVSDESANIPETAPIPQLPPQDVVSPAEDNIGSNDVRKRLRLQLTGATNYIFKLRTPYKAPTQSVQQSSDTEMVQTQGETVEPMKQAISESIDIGREGNVAPVEDNGATSQRTDVVAAVREEEGNVGLAGEIPEIKSNGERHIESIPQQPPVREEEQNVDPPVAEIPEIQSIPRPQQEPVNRKIGKNVTTRSIAAILEYNDADENENELIPMERIEVVSKDANELNEMSEDELHQLWIEQCNGYGFPPPLTLAEFQSTDWRHVSKYDDSMLSEGFVFKTADDLANIKRRHPKFKFCHPGPSYDDETKTANWFYADSIIQEVQLKSEKQTTYFVVRWVGYEDQFNTLETEVNVSGTAIWKLHKLKDYATAARSKGAILLRRSTRLVNNVVTPILTLDREVLRGEKYMKAIHLLDEHLAVENRADRYHPEVGFVSSDGDVLNALRNQFSFIKNVFLPIVNDMKCDGFCMSPHYLGSLFGNNRSKKFTSFEIKPIKNESSIERYIREGLKAERTDDDVGFVSFLVFSKYGNDETDQNKHLDMHVCVYTVRSQKEERKKVKDVMYFDPSPRSHRHLVPDCLKKLQKPKIRSSTRCYGILSRVEDCLYQCCKYVIGLHTGEIPFVADLQQKKFIE